MTDEMYEELAAGLEDITCKLDDNRKVYIKNYTLNYIYNKMKIQKYISLCGISGYKMAELPEMNAIEQIVFNKQMDLKIAIFLNEFVKQDNIQYDESTDEFIVIVGKSETRLTRADIDKVFENFREIYCLTGGKQPFNEAKPITDEGKELLEIFRKAQVKIDTKKNGNVTMGSIMLGVSVKHPSINLINIKEYTVWQLMQTHSWLYKVDDVYFTKLGIYTGNIDTKKANIKPEELNWSGRMD